jgi:hypothetical protein
MIRRWAAALALAALSQPFTAAAQEAVDGEDRLGHAAGADVFFQADADDTEVWRAGVNLDAVYDGPQKYRGLRLEKAWFNPLGQGWEGRERIYLRAADKSGGWNWQANVGTDGKTVLGSASVHDDSRYRREFFVERDVLETPRGLSEGIYHTFAGAAVDLPLDERNQLTLVAGIQEFTGENLRQHLRANYIHMVGPGVSAQLRTRWFRNSHPREADYYSPRWYAQVLPVLQVRGTTDEGTRLLLVGGLGVQRDSGTGWRRASYAAAQATSPPVAPGWSVTGGFVFTETPTTSGQSYSYFQMNMGIVRAF